MAVLAIVEILVFARTHRPTYPLAAMRPPAAKEFFQEHPGTQRTLNVDAGNLAMGFRAYDIWGYDPVVLGRYMQFMAWSQGLNPDAVAAADVVFTSYNPLYAMLRCQFVSVEKAGVRQFGQVPGEALPQLLLMRKYQVIPRRDDIFAAMANPHFDPRRSVILEAEPQPAPSGLKPVGKGEISEASTDGMTIEVETSQPAILVLTDSYSKDWKAWSLKDSAQREYLLCRRITFCARFLCRRANIASGWISPAGFVWGNWISIAAWLGFSLLLMRWLSRRVGVNNAPNSRVRVAAHE